MKSRGSRWPGEAPREPALLHTATAPCVQPASKSIVTNSYLVPMNKMLYVFPYSFLEPWEYIRKGRVLAGPRKNPDAAVATISTGATVVIAAPGSEGTFEALLEGEKCHKGVLCLEHNNREWDEYFKFVRVFLWRCSAMAAGGAAVGIITSWCKC